MLGSDDEVPSDLEAIFEKEAPLDNCEGGKAPLRGEGGKKEKRRKLKHLPTFADADEDAKMLEGEQGEGGEETAGSLRKAKGKGKGKKRGRGKKGRWMRDAPKRGERKDCTAE